MSTRGRPQSITDEAMLAAAKDVFIEQGMNATTAEIARRAGISESVLFYRYKTKEALFVAVLDSHNKVLPAVEALASKVGEGAIEDHLFELGQAAIADIEAVFPLMMTARMMTQGGGLKAEELSARMRRPHPAQIQTVKLVASYFEEEARLGRMRAVDADVLARVFTGSLFQYVMTQRWFEGAIRMPLSSPMFLRGLIDILLKGTLPTAGDGNSLAAISHERLMALVRQKVDHPGAVKVIDHLLSRKRTVMDRLLRNKKKR